MVKIVKKKPGNGRLNNLNDTVLTVLKLPSTDIVFLHILPNKSFFVYSPLPLSPLFDLFVLQFYSL